MTATTNKKVFVSIQFLRFFAAMLVVELHTTDAVIERISAYSHESFSRIGNCGVDIFFVISGFVMAVSTKNKIIGITERLKYALLFCKKRIVRIVPLYWFYTTLKIILMLLLPKLAVHTKLAGTYVFSTFFFLPIRMQWNHIHEIKNPWDLFQPILPVGWTLHFELLFYFVFALGIVVQAPRLIWCLAVFIPLFYLGKIYTDSEFLLFYSWPLLFEFIAEKT